MSEAYGISETVQEEIWVAIPGTDGLYSVSSLGRVRSEVKPGRTGRGCFRQSSHMMTLRPNNRERERAYLHFSACFPGRMTKKIKVHRAVALAFLGPCPDGMEVNHKNGIKMDNRLENLEYVTAKENTRHAYANGLRPRGEATYNAKLTEQIVRSIRAEAAAGRTTGELVAAFNLSYSRVCNIVARRCWAHVE